MTETTGKDYAIRHEDVERFHTDELVATGRLELERMDDGHIWGRITTAEGKTIELGFFTDMGEIRFTAEVDDVLVQ